MNNADCSYKIPRNKPKKSLAINLVSPMMTTFAILKYAHCRSLGKEEDN